MVYYFTSNVVSPSAFVYVGKDKVENEDLIKFGLEEDVWFHADKLSSAHIYLRMNEGTSWESIPEEVLTDLAQLTKANSIEGNKKDNVTVIYTPWANLKKDGSMAVGQVSFKDPRKVKRIIVPQRENPIINRLNKTKVEKFPDLQMEKEDRLKAMRKKDQSARLERKKEEGKIAQERKDKKWQKEHAYDDLFTGDDDPEEANNQDRDDLEDDFM
ncbi:Coiled-coil domain-containing protein [Lachnellula occidentalis]|uniref:Coiled-coil domain-containing protein n=1 Tax=Lachnellula occidentalis TaxID=215460 RepID=A0A8H8S6K5_9HELO|nr:Coiled-coil domain-containing protein [Lachnellula occidentalis]